MAESPDRRWLILVHQLPPRPSNLRVRVWRRLQQVGAVVLRNSLYVLPSTDEAREDFNWVREEIISSGGEVSVFEASTVDGYTDAELVQQFRAARNATERVRTVAAERGPRSSGIFGGFANALLPSRREITSRRPSARMPSERSLNSKGATDMGHGPRRTRNWRAGTSGTARGSRGPGRA
jgi:hypothetical protein